jgi:SAM-dependent methyltransferase
MVAIVSHKREAIQRAVRDMYTAVATAPDQAFHFPTGRSACQLLGYPAAQLDRLPQQALESFAGVGYPFAAGAIRDGDHVLDVGSGSGTDALISAALAGRRGRVYALDMTPGMRDKLRAAAAAAGVTNLEVLDGDAEAIPLADQSVDAVTTNGVLNLVPDKARAIGEIFRVLKPGGRLQISDIALSRPVAERFRQDPQMWAECVVGAVEEERYLALLRNVGFERVERLGDLDYFGLSSNARTREVAGLFNAHSVTLRAEKPRAAARGGGGAGTRSLLNLASEITGVAAAVVAWFVCAGAPPLLAAFGAIGAAGLAQHAYMFPAFAALLGVSVWLIWRSGRLREDLRPFWLALGGAVFAIATTWMALVGIATGVAWFSYAGIAGLVGASAWSFVLSRARGDCAAEMIRDARRRRRRRSLAWRLLTATLGGLLAAATLYGLYVSVQAFAAP